MEDMPGEVEGAFLAYAMASDATIAHVASRRDPRRWDDRLFDALCEVAIAALIPVQYEPWEVGERAVGEAIAAAIAERG